MIKVNIYEQNLSHSTLLNIKFSKYKLQILNLFKII